jgi:hypothetical protein
MRKIYAIVRIFFKVEPEVLEWDELMKLYGEAAFYMQHNADLIANAVVRDISKAMDK